MTTSFRAIENETATIQLHDLINNNTLEYRHEPALHFTKAEFEAYWDNELYLLDFFKGLAKKKTKHRKELKEYCTKNSFNYKETEKELVAIYKQSKKLNFWEQRK